MYKAHNHTSRIFSPFRFTHAKAYRALLDELGDQAGQHEVVAENLSSQVAQELAQLVRQLKEDRRKVRREHFAFKTVLYCMKFAIKITKQCVLILN